MNQPRLPDAASLQKSVLLHARARELCQQGQLQQAAQAFQEAIRACPANAAPYLGFIEMLFSIDDVANAAKVIAAAPASVYRQSPALQGHHAAVLLRQQDYAQARPILEGLQGAPGFDAAKLNFNLGVCYASLFEDEKAHACFTQAQRAGMDEAGLYTIWTVVCQRLGRDDEAAALYRSAAAKFPQDGDLMYEYASFLLRHEEYAEGFRLFFHRWRTRTGEKKKVSLPIPEWRGEGRPESLLVVKEQGIGDQMIFCALLPALAGRAQKVTVAFDSRLHALIRRSFPEFEVADLTGVSAGEISARFDAYIQAADVGAVSVDSVGQPGYLHADAARVAALREKYAALFPGKKLVGISWKSPKAPLDTFKSIPLAAWAPILGNPDCQFISLQYGDVADDLRMAREQLGVDIHLDAGIDSFNDIDGLAAQIGALDLVITISNTTAHVAATTGRPTWVLLSEARGLFWYWGWRKDRTAWYPAARLFRAGRDGHWDDVIAEVASALQPAP